MPLACENAISQQHAPFHLVGVERHGVDDYDGGGDTVEGGGVVGDRASG